MVEELSVTPNYEMSKLLSAFGPLLEMNKDLARFTSYKTGGRAKYFVAVENADEVIKVVNGAKRLKIPFFLIGGGSNLLVSDHGYNGMVIKIDVKGMSLDKNIITCGAGEDLMNLVKFSADKAMSGLEFAAGIWGSVGGAIYGNAGAFGGEIGSFVKDLQIVDYDGNVKTVDADYCKFEYRDSYLKSTGEIVISARFEVQPGDKHEINKKIDEILSMREDKHPDSLTAGCFFKNIPDDSQPHGKLAAGKLLEEAGAKDLSVGGAKVFEKHANIIVNSGNATSKDIRELADIMKKKVFDKFSIELQEEVIKLGEF